jgi:hypothetical protein
MTEHVESTHRRAMAPKRKSWRRCSPQGSSDRQRTEDVRKRQGGKLVLVQLFAIVSRQNLAARTSYALPINQLLKHRGSIASRAPH